MGSLGGMMTVEAAFIITYVNIIIISFLVCAFIYHDKCLAKAEACAMVLDGGKDEPDLSALLITDKNKAYGKETIAYRQYYIDLKNRYIPVLFRDAFDLRIKISALVFGTDPVKTIRFFSVFKEEYMGKGAK